VGPPEDQRDFSPACFEHAEKVYTGGTFMTDEKLIRTFLAIDLPDEIKETLGKIQNRLKPLIGGATRNIKWTKPEGIHLTLIFLGYISSSEIVLVSETVKKNVEGVAPFMLNLGSPGAFPTITRPRVIYLGLNGQTDILCSLQKQIATDLDEIGFKKEDRPFTSHLTLGRLKSAFKLPGIEEAFHKVMGLAKGNFIVNGLKLYRSDLRPDGAVYTTLEFFPLTGK
jgi:2'-5' RNA ligase